MISAHSAVFACRRARLRELAEAGWRRSARSGGRLVGPKMPSHIGRSRASEMPKAAKIMTRKGSVWLGAKAHIIASAQPRPTEIAVVASVKIGVVTMVLRNAGSVKSLNEVADTDIFGFAPSP